MNILSDTELSTKINRDLEEVELLKFFDTLSLYGDVLFFGGYIRDSLLNIKDNIRDIDVVFYPQVSFISLENLINDNFKKISTNKFKGYKIDYFNISIDIWELNNTWGIRGKNIDYNDLNIVDAVKLLEKSTFLNNDSIIYNYTKDRVHKNIFMDSMKNKLLDVQYEINPDIEVNLLKNLIQKKKYESLTKDSFTVSKRLSNIYDIYTKEKGIDRLYSRQLTRYNKEYFTNKELTNEIHQIIKYL